MRMLLATVLALLPATVGSGTITVNKGANGVTVGMTRAAVIAKLGKPIYQNKNGYLQYANDPNIFDVYLNPANRVRLVSISGKHFCTTGGVCMFTNGALAKLKAQYGRRLKLVKTEDGSLIWQVRGTFQGKQVFTSFTPAPHGQIIQVFVGFY
jgi:hypothetical protein